MNVPSRARSPSEEPGEAAVEPAALEEGLDGLLHDAAQGAVARLEPLVVRAKVALEVPLEEAVERRPLGMPRDRDSGRHRTGPRSPPRQDAPALRVMHFRDQVLAEAQEVYFAA